MTDNEIINLVREGKKEYFRFLVERYQGKIFTTLVGFLHNTEDANDLTQEVFIKAFQSLKSFRGDAQFSTWIYRIAINAALNKTRKSGIFKYFRQYEMEHEYEKSDADDNPESVLIKKETRKLIRKALNRLPDKQKTAFILSKYNELSQKEIAAIMHTSESAVESLIHRAKLNLQQNLQLFYKKIKT